MRTADSSENPVNRDVVCVANVSKAYPSPFSADAPRFVLKNVSFSVPANRISVLFGPNGCGKTTLVRILAGLTDFDEGSVSIDREPPSPGRCSVVFQNFAATLFPWRTAIGNLQFPLATRTTSNIATQDAAFIRRCVEEVGITYSLDSRTYQLSVGQQQLLALARALVQDSDLLLLDEPFSGLDYASRRHLQDWLPKYVDANKKSALLITHDLDEAVLLAQRLVLLPRIPGVPGLTLDLPVGPVPRPRQFLLSEMFLDVRARVLKFYDS